MAGILLLVTMLETTPTRSARHEGPDRGRRRGLIVLTILVLLLAGIAVGIGAFYTWATGASGPQNPVVVVIPQGASGSAIATLLKERDVIRSPFAFRLLARFRAGSGFQAGKYKLTTNMKASAAIDVLKEGPFVESVEVTFPEGYRVEQDAERVHKELGIASGAFLAEARSGEFSLEGYLAADAPTVEGFLFPDTYEFLRDARAGDVIQRMIDQFQKVSTGLPWEKAKGLGYNRYEIVIVASMIEREARVPEDRARIATVIYNRLKRGMPLQIDATIQYARGSTKAKLTYDDLKIDSPYNTYLHTGLPPTPIASPGEASLLAALNPVKADWLYFVVIDSEGHSAFTASYQEFLRLKAKAAG